MGDESSPSNSSSDSKRSDSREPSGKKSPNGDDDLAETSKLEAVTSKHDVEELVKKSREQGLDDVNDQTEQLSREEILRMAERDRGAKQPDGELHHKETRREKSIPVRDGDAPESKTTEMPKVDQTTEEMDSGDFDQPGKKLDESEGWSIHEVPEEEVQFTGEFKGRVQSGLRLVIPSRLAADMELEPGDVVEVEVKKLDD